jgi:hypothetical protein
LSTDEPHDVGVPFDRVERCAELIVDRGARLIVQVLDVGRSVGRTLQMLADRFGEHWTDVADVVVTSPLPYARGALVFAPRPPRGVETFGPCDSLGSPVIAHDGRVTPCCNEELINGAGPVSLRPRAADAAEATAAIERFDGDALLHLMRVRGPAGIVRSATSVGRRTGGEMRWTDRRREFCRPRPC